MQSLVFVVAAMLTVAACGRHRRDPDYGGSPPSYGEPTYGAPAPAPAYGAPAEGFAVGQRVKVEWKGSWWPAVVMQAQPGQWFVHYENYDHSWDEWVGPARIRAMPAPGVRGVGAHVRVEWKGSWYPAVILQVQNGQFLVHYDGYESSWDEWVGPDRMRDP